MVTAECSQEAVRGRRCPGLWGRLREAPLRKPFQLATKGLKDVTWRPPEAPLCKGPVQGFAWAAWTGQVALCRAPACSLCPLTHKGACATRTDAAPDVSGPVVRVAGEGAGEGEEAELRLVPDVGTLNWWGWETPSET